MEEDIKIQDLIEHIRFGTQLKYDMKTYLIAIENLIARYKELEECLKAEESYSKSLNNDIKSLLHIEPNDNFIPKSKVQEKIEEIENRFFTYKMLFTDEQLIEDEIKVLQELLED